MNRRELLGDILGFVLLSRLKFGFAKQKAPELLWFELEDSCTQSGIAPRPWPHYRLMGTVNSKPWHGYAAGTCLLLNFCLKRPRLRYFKVMYKPDGHDPIRVNGEDLFLYESQSFLPLANARRIEVPK